jgi:hypothetical protein
MVSRDVIRFALRGRELLRTEPLAPDRLEPVAALPAFSRSVILSATAALLCWCSLPASLALARPCGTLALPGETEAGSAGEQPDQGIARPMVRQWCIPIGPHPRRWLGAYFLPCPIGHQSYALKNAIDLCQRSAPLLPCFTSALSPGLAAGSSARARSAPRSCAAAGRGSLSPVPRRQPESQASP